MLSWLIIPTNNPGRFPIRRHIVLPQMLTELFFSSTTTSGTSAGDELSNLTSSHTKALDHLFYQIREL